MLSPPGRMLSIPSFRKVSCHLMVHSRQDLLKESKKTDNWRRWDSCRFMTEFLGCFWLTLRSLPGGAVQYWCTMAKEAVVSLHACLPSYRRDWASATSCTASIFCYYHTVFLCFLPCLISRSWLSFNEVLDLFELFSKGEVNKTGWIKLSELVFFIFL